MADAPPPRPAVILKGWAHLTAQLAQTVPTQLQRANRVRRFTVSQLRKGKA